MTDETIEESVLSTIKSGKTKMRPRWVFVARAIVMAFSVLLLFAALLYLASFIIFALHQNDVWFAPGFGMSGWSLLLGALPWGLLLFSFALLIALASVMHHYAFVYHRPFSVLLFVVAILVILGSFGIAATSFHAAISHYAEENMPTVGYFYQFETIPPARMHRGDIVEVASSGFMIADDGGVTSAIIVDPEIIMSDGFGVGDTVIVLGNRDASGSIQAFGVEKIAP
jgi:hypothetical protein